MLNKQQPPPTRHHRHRRRHRRHRHRRHLQRNRVRSRRGRFVKQKKNGLLLLRRVTFKRRLLAKLTADVATGEPNLTSPLLTRHTRTRRNARSAPALFERPNRFF